MPLMDNITLQFATMAGNQLRKLLETQHLYQKVSIDAKELLDSLNPAATAVHLGTILNTKLTLTENPTVHTNVLSLYLPVRNVKLFCGRCDAREAFRPIWFSDITEQLREKYKTQRALNAETFRIMFGNNFQLFDLVYQCQRCEHIPNAFLVKRQGNELVLEGRSPIENTELPTFIPREEKKWFRDSVIAFQTGNILAALFYLRTFIEQFARRKTGMLDDKRTGDELLSAYADTLPMNLRDTMPSLKEWYDRLSDAIHTAKEDDKLFKEAREKIEEHFDIRRVHKLDAKAVSQTEEKVVAIADNKA